MRIPSMLPGVHSTVLALTTRLLDSHGLKCDRNSTVAEFILAQQTRMPDYLRLPFGFLTLLFAVWPLMTRLRPFHRLTPERQRAQIVAWKSSRFGHRRDLIRFYESLSIFGEASARGEIR